LSPYEVLGVGPDATAEEIRSAYRHLVRELHPDTRSPALDAALADEALRRVQVAWRSVTSHETADVSFEVTEHEGEVTHRPRFPWWFVAIAVMVAIFIVTAYAGSVPVSSP
jgi:preprotein translocase subunit Sec63